MEPLKIKHAEQVSVRSINEALKLLNEAADNSAEEIREMVSRDYQGLRQIFAEGRHEVGGTLRELKSAAVESVTQVKDRAVAATKETAKSIDEGAHRNPWSYVAGASVLAAFVGFLMGRKSRG